MCVRVCVCVCGVRVYVCIFYELCVRYTIIFFLRYIPCLLVLKRKT